MFYKTFTGKTSFPLPVSIAGSFTSSGSTITINNAPNLAVGDYLYSTANNEVRKVIGFITANQLSLESAFSVDISVATPIQVTDKSKAYNKVSIITFGATEGVLNGSTTGNGSMIDITEGELVFTIDATGTKMSILATP